MICDENRDLLELYALGLLEPEEHVTLSTHLATGCGTCNPNLSTAVALNTAILLTVPDAHPSGELRERVVTTVRPSRGAGSASWWMGLAGALAACLAWFWVVTQGNSADLGRQLTQARGELDATRSQVQQLNAAFDFLRDPQTRPANASRGANRPRGTFFISPRGVLLIASGLAPVSGSQTYEMWVIPKSQSPRAAGLFRPGAAGSAIHFQPAPVDIGSAAALAVSVEPAGGSAAPTTTPLLVTPVAAE